MKRSWKAALVVGAIVLAAGAAAYHYVLTFEPDRTRFPVRGIDASHHQGAIDWQQVARDDVAFAYVKVSEGGDHRVPEAGSSGSTTLPATSPGSTAKSIST